MGKILAFLEPFIGQTTFNVIILLLVFIALIIVLNFLKRFLPHPEIIEFGTENIKELFNIGTEIEGFKVSDIVYYTKIGKTIDSCQRYLRSRGVEMLYKAHIDAMLNNKVAIPEEWKKLYFGHPPRFLFIGIFVVLDDYNFYVHYLEYKNGQIVRGTLPSNYKLQLGDFIVTARKKSKE